MNDGDLQVKAVHKILGYDPIQKSFMALKYVIKAKDPPFQKITVAEHSFFSWTGGDPALLRRRTRVGGLRRN